MSLQTRNALWAGLPRPKFDENHELHLPGYEPQESSAILARMLSDDVDAWSVAASRVGFCSNPLHLVGVVHHHQHHRRGARVVLLCR